MKTAKASVVMSRRSYPTETVLSNKITRNRIVLSSKDTCSLRKPLKTSVLMQRLSYPTETVLSNKITRNRTVLSFKDSPRKPIRWRPLVIVDSHITALPKVPSHIFGIYKLHM